MDLEYKLLKVLTVLKIFYNFKVHIQKIVYVHLNPRSVSKNLFCMILIWTSNIDFCSLKLNLTRTSQFDSQNNFLKWIWI